MSRGSVTLYEAKRMLSDPPVFRRGIQQLVLPPSPAVGNSLVYKISGDYWERLLAMSATLVTGATGGIRELVLNYQDGDGGTFDQVPLAGNINPSQTVSAFGDFTIPSNAAVNQSSNAEGRQAAPAANTVIVTTVTLPPGTYLVKWTVELEGTLAIATDDDNFQLRANAATVATSSNAAVAGTYPQQDQIVTLFTSGTIVIRNGLAGTAGSTYLASITATLQDVPAAKGMLPDFIMETGWQIGVTVNNIQATDQISGVRFLVERYGSKYARGGYHDEEMQNTRELLDRIVTGEW